MRTLQEKYNAVLEGNFSKEQFRRDAAMQLPNLVSKFNSFEDMASILKNRGMIAEAKTQAPKYSTVKPEDTIAPDVLDTGIKFELDKKYGTLDVTDEQYAKCREMAIKNLAKDVLYYVKQDSIQLETPGEKMEKAKLKEGYLKPAEVLRTITGKKKKVVDRAARTYTWKVLSAEEIQKMIDAKVAEYDSRSTPDEKLDYAVHDVVGGSVESSGPGYAEYSLANANDEQIKLFKKFMDANDEESYDTLLSIRDRVYRDGKEHQPEKSYMKSPDTWKDHAKHLKWDIGDATSKMMGIKENEAVDRPSALAAVRSALKGKYEKIEDRDIAEFLKVNLKYFMGEDPVIDINDRKAILDEFEEYVYSNEDFRDIQDMIDRIGFYEKDQANEAGDDVNVDKFERKRTNTRDFASTPKEREDGTYDISGMMKEAQLKEAIKKIIAKVITE